jgi:sugar O-acyltransferase (sialic acid O-acetyltransferase NeuD family)
MNVLIETPRINANEDELQIIEIRVSKGQRVGVGDTLFVLETTKAAVEINAPQAGTIDALTVKIGDFVQVGWVLCKITDAVGDVGAEPVLELSHGDNETKITAKARKLAETMGIDLARLEAVNGRIGEAQVYAAANLKLASGKGRQESFQIPSASLHSRRAVIIGGGGHAACLIDALQGSGYEILGCTDQNLTIGHHVCAGITVIGNDDCLERLLTEGVLYAFVGIGGAISGETRRLMFERAQAMGYKIPTIIHPRAVVSSNSRIGDGCHILAGAIIGPRCSIGNNVIINQGSNVCHDSVVDDHAHLAPGSILAGNVSVGPKTVIGMAVTVMLKLRIGSNVLIHNGAHIKNDVADDTIVDVHGKRHLRNPVPS